jgi:hypothetical protein
MLQVLKNKQALSLPLGAGFLAIGLVLGRFLPGNNLSDFLQGFLVGLSIVLNLSDAFSRFKKRLSY